MVDEREPMVVLADMTRLRELWPPEVFNHMKWFQQDLELMRKSAKKQYAHTRPMPCKFCGKVIRVDMYRHVARLHLDLVQLWRCPIAWCTTWKGSPQDCLEHLRNGHDTPWISKTASIEKYAPPWTVRRELWTDSLRVEHSGISTDILLFSELGLSLTQHYRVYRGGLPHVVFRMDYIERLRSLLQSSGQPGSTPKTGRGSTPKSARRLHRSSQPRRLLSEAVDDGPLLTLQNPADVVGETVFDCRPSVLPVSIPVQIVAPEIPPAGTADPFGRGDGFDLDLARVMLDVSVIPSMISPLEESEVPPPSRAAEYAAPATPAVETVLESPGYTVPEELAFTWIPGFVPVSEAVLEEEGGGGEYAVSRTTASTFGSDIGRGTGCHFGGNSTVYTDDASDPRRQEDRLQHGRCLTNRSGEGVCGGSDGGVHLISNVSRCSGRRSGFDKGGTLRCV